MTLSDEQRAALADADARLAKAQSVGASILSNATLGRADIAKVLAADTPPPAQPAVIYGTCLGGWWSTLGEVDENARRARIKAGFGGRLPAIRSFRNNGQPAATEVDDTCRLNLTELAYGRSDAQLDADFKAMLPNTVACPAHEPENPGKNIRPADYQAYITRVGAAHVRSGRQDVKVALVFMYGTFGPRYNWIQNNVPWDQWIPNPLPAGIDAIGADVYPSYGRGTTKPADTIQVLADPVLAAAKKLGCPVYIPEFGCGKKEWLDQERADFTRASFDYFDANAGSGPGQIVAVTLFEADNGGGGPWCILPKPDPATQGAWDWPLTVAVVRERISAVPTA